eukprot:3494187-Pyramimonas_sp.AAC.1
MRTTDINLRLLVGQVLCACCVVTATSLAALALCTLPIRIDRNEQLYSGTAEQWDREPQCEASLRALGSRPHVHRTAVLVHITVGQNSGAESHFAACRCEPSDGSRTSIGRLRT